MDAADFFSVKYTYITEGFVEHAHSLGKEICAWTLNYQGDMQRMVNCGVDNIITDDPELVRKVILGTWKLHGRESKHAIPEERKEEKEEEKTSFGFL